MTDEQLEYRPITKADWKVVESVLAGAYGRVRMRCDGYLVQLSVRRIKPRQYAILVYVNGWSKGEWLGSKSDSEEARRFLQIKTVKLYSDAQRKKLVKAFGKRRATEMGVFGERQYRQLHWTSVPAMKKHFVANNSLIEICVDDAKPIEDVIDVYR